MPVIIEEVLTEAARPERARPQSPVRDAPADTETAARKALQQIRRSEWRSARQSAE